MALRQWHHTAQSRFSRTAHTGKSQNFGLTTCAGFVVEHHRVWLSDRLVQEKSALGHLVFCVRCIVVLQGLYAGTCVQFNTVVLVVCAGSSRTTQYLSTSC